MQMLWPILIVVAANTVYNICAKQTPEALNPFFSLIITYGVAMLFSAIMFFVSAEDKSLTAELSKTNWASYILGMCIVFLEFGMIYVYRVGWNISTATLVSNISLAVILLVVGLLCYKENISARQLIGIVICGAGLVLVSRP